MINWRVPSKPKILRDIYVVPHDQDSILVRRGKRFIKLRGESVRSVILPMLPLLDGQHTVDQIGELLQNVKREEIFKALGMLYVKGIVEDASPPNSLSLAPEELTTYQNQLNFFSYFHPVNRYHYQELLKQAKVVILGLGDIANHLLLSLVSCGVGKIKAVDLGLAAGEDSAAGTIIDAKVNILKAKITDLNPLISFELVITSVKSSQDIRNLIKGYDLAVLPLDRPSIAIFDWINEACLYEKITWISGVLDAEEGVVGPCVVPFLTPCYKCYELRMKANLTSYQEYIIFEAYLREHSADNLHYGGFQPSAGIVGNLLAMEVIKILNKFEAPITYSNVFTINFLTLETKTHEILKLPRCPACGPTKKVPRQRAWDVEG